MLNDEDFGEDEYHLESSNEKMNKASMSYISNHLYNDGYRIGKINKDSQQMQLGFNKGFHNGMLIGKACGELYSYIRYYLSQLSNDHTSNILSDNIEHLKHLEEILFIRMPTSNNQRISEYIEEIESLVLQISTSLKDTLILFKNQIICIDNELTSNIHSI